MENATKTNTIEIAPARLNDLGALLSLFSDARAWHEAKGVDVWSAFDATQIASDVAQGKVFVARMFGQVCGTVTLVDSDALVWGSDDGQAIYVHRLTTSRKLAGKGIGGDILQWAGGFAKQRGKRYLRLDTWNENPGMRDYYERHGFRHVRDKFFPIGSPLPVDYGGTTKSLYELDLT